MHTAVHYRPGITEILFKWIFFSCFSYFVISFHMGNLNQFDV